MHGAPEAIIGVAPDARRTGFWVRRPRGPGRTSGHVRAMFDFALVGNLARTRVLKEQLLTIFRLTYYWKAILLLNKADVFI